MDWYWWLAIMLILVAIEALTLDLFLFMFAGGAIAAALAALGTDNLAIQAIVFAVTSVLLVGALRPWLLRNLRLRGPLPETNLAAQIGSGAIVVHDVDHVTGRVKFHGEVWSARAATEETFPVGTEVIVTHIDGATAVVAFKTAPDRV